RYGPHPPRFGRDHPPRGSVPGAEHGDRADTEVDGRPVRARASESRRPAKPARSWSPLSGRTSIRRASSSMAMATSWRGAVGGRRGPWRAHAAARVNNVVGVAPDGVDQPVVVAADDGVRVGDPDEPNQAPDHFVVDPRLAGDGPEATHLRLSDLALVAATLALA